MTKNIYIGIDGGLMDPEATHPPSALKDEKSLFIVNQNTRNF